jgi:hypothetical protein
MGNILDRIHHFSKGWVVLTSILVMTIFMIVVLPIQGQKSQEELGTSTSPDTSFFYTPDQLFKIAADYGKAGRQAYIRARWTFDLIYPLVYGFFLTTGISWFYSYITPRKQNWQYLILLPVLGVGFDYLENITTSLVMAIYPAQITFLAIAASVITLLKWIMIGLAFLVYFSFIVWALIRRFQK